MKTRPEVAGDQDERPGCGVMPQPELPTIMVTGRQQIEIIDDAWAALLSRNDPPQVFVTSGQISRLLYLEPEWTIQVADEAIVNGLLVRSARWMQKNSGGEMATRPPREVIRDLLANPSPQLPKLTGIAATPVFDASGMLLNRRGYCAGAALSLQLDATWDGCDVPTQPNEVELRTAVALLLDDLLIDFPFRTPSDRAHAVAAMILPFVRRMIQGPTPLHLFEAPTAGSGKSRLADLVRIVAFGDLTGTITFNADEGEARKKFTSLLRSGTQVIFLDNVRGGIRSAELAAILTADMWKDRMLGSNTVVQYPNRALWLATANNPELSLEIARRCVSIRIVPKEERPWTRTNFKHADIVAWAREHRGPLVLAVLTIVQSWIAAGKPLGARVRGSFEAWSHTMGGILEHCGLPDLLGSDDDFYINADPQSEEWAALVAAWWEEHRDGYVVARDLLNLAESTELVAWARTGGSEQSQFSRFGWALRQLRDKRLAGLEVEFSTDRHTRARRYRLRPAPSQSALEAKGSA